MVKSKIGCQVFLKWSVVAQGRPTVSHLFHLEINGRQLFDPGQQSVFHFVINVSKSSSKKTYLNSSKNRFLKTIYLLWSILVYNILMYLWYICFIFICCYDMNKSTYPSNAYWTWDFLVCYRHIFVLLKAKIVTSANEIKFQFNCTN